MNIGEFRHSVRLQSPTRTKTAGGGYTLTPADLTDPEWWCAIESASAAKMERLAGAGSISTASHILTGRYHPEITTRTTIVYGTRTFAVRGVQNVNEGDEWTRVFCEEVVQ